MSDDTDRLGVVTDGLVPRTLADHQAFTLLAFCQTCDRSVELDHQALAGRCGWDVLLQNIRRRLRCEKCGLRNQRLLVGYQPERGRLRACPAEERCCAGSCG